MTVKQRYFLSNWLLFKKDVINNIVLDIYGLVKNNFMKKDKLLG